MDYTIDRIHKLREHLKEYKATLEDFNRLMRIEGAYIEAKSNILKAFKIGMVVGACVPILLFFVISFL